METITNLTKTASNAIWGTSSQEPISGKTGDVSKGEPYDAGNMDPHEPEHIENASPGPNDAVPKKSESSSLPTEDIQKSALHPGSEGYPQTTTTTSTKPPSDDNHSNNENNNTVSDVNPAAVKDSSTTTGDATAVQNDVRDPSDPATHPDKIKGRDNVDDADGGFDAGDNPEKLDGPGPRPVAEIAKENGGDAGKGSREGLSSPDAEQSPVPKKDEEEDHKDDKGMLYVKSSGLKADGGDFDATKPGAGREADRLLEEKGVKRSEQGGLSGDLPDGGTNGSHKEKKGLKEKIKAKLHKLGPA